MGEYERKVIEYNLEKEKKERIRESAIWIGLLILFTAFFLLAVYNHSLDLMIKYNGNSVVAKYSQNTANATYVDRNGRSYNYVDVDSLTEKKGDIIMLYYYGDNIEKARPVTVLGFFLAMYFFWGMLIVLCIYKLYTTIKVKKHYTGERI